MDPVKTMADIRKFAETISGALPDLKPFLDQAVEFSVGIPAETTIPQVVGICVSMGVFAVTGPLKSMAKSLKDGAYQLEMAVEALGHIRKDIQTHTQRAYGETR